MTPTEANQLSACFIRQMFLIKMLQTEQNYFLKQVKFGGIKHTLKRLKDANEKGVEQLLTYLPNSRHTADEVMKTSEEKIAAMANILENLSALDEETVLKLEDDFNNHIKINY